MPDEKERLRLVADHAPVLLAHCDAQHRFQFVNAPYARRFGLAPEAVIGRTLPEVLGEQAFEQIRPYAEQALAGKRVEFEVELQYRDIGAQFMHCAYAPHINAEGRVVGYFAALSNIDDRKRAEQQLRQSEEQLRLALAEQAQAEHRKDEFLATLAHELRNPLAPIRNAVQLIRLKAPQDVELTRARQMIERQVDHLTRLVDDLLDVARISHGKLELQKEPLQLAAVVDYALEITKPLIEARRHTLTVKVTPEPVTVHADAARLTQALANILSNAAKFTEPGGSITLTAERAGGDAVIRIRDDGIGIPPDLLPHVFDLFQQGDRTLDRAEGGLGIGLSLVKRLIMMHGGSVEAHSEGAGKGSEFVIRLPVLQAEKASAQASTTAPQETAARGAGGQPRRRRVLIVDDNRDAADSMALLLRMQQHTVQAVYSGPAALGAARVFKPDIVFLDIGLPGMNGLEIARRLREFPETRSTKLIAVTGYGQAEDRKKSQEAGFDLHIVKPVDMDELSALLTS